MDGVETFLSRLGLTQYIDVFKTKGFDCEDDIPSIQSEDLDAMYIENPTDRKKILQAALHFQPSVEFVLYDWLRSKGLEHYFVGFVQSELIDLVDIGRLNLPNEELYDELEITLPGHKRRFERAVHSLRKKQKGQLPSFVTSSLNSQPSKQSTVPPSTTLGSELPVAYGRWGKPKCLVDAKYDFLVLDATVISTNDSRDRVHIEFMVDSGSDVVTLRQEVLDTMDLELIGPINSKGVHGSKVKNLYRAYILVGNQYVEIEVMGESYDSIGSRVMRHFRHYINGSHHLWLKGDFIDPTMSCIEKPFISEKLNSAKSENSRLSSQQEDVDKVKSVVDDSRPDNEEDQDDAMLVQKDSVPKIIKIHDDMVPAHPDIECNKSEIEKVAENGVSDSETHNEDNNVDEPDKVLCTGGEIIDIRPIIAANRKRHASSAAGMDPSNMNGHQAKRKRLILESYENGKGLFDDGLGVKVKAPDNNLDTLQVVLNQRSVFYRSQATEIKVS